MLWAVSSAALLCVVSCRSRRYAAPTGPMPPRTVLLSAMMQELSDQPGFTDAVLREMQSGGKKGAALLTPELLRRLRELILGKDWEGLNRFPGWTMRAITPTVGAAGHLVRSDAATPGGERDQLADGPAGDRASDGSGTAVSPAVDAGAATGGTSNAGAPNLDRLPSAQEVAGVIDVGELALDQERAVDLDQRSQAETTLSPALVKQLGFGVISGDGPDPELIKTHAESVRLARLLNRLSLNHMNISGAEAARVVTAAVGDHVAHSPEELVAALVATGHTVRVADARFFANFGHFHYKGQDVMMPFWVDTQLEVPHTDRPLLVPVAHAEYEWQVRGPRVNADVAFYYGIDGRAEFRTMDEHNQPWVLGRFAHVYTGEQAREVTRLTGRMALAYMHQHVARPELPFGGYYTLGVCQDVVAAIEKHMTGKATLFPNTADARLFNDPRDAEINELIAAIPKDRTGATLDPGRVFDSMPTTDLRAITIPGLADDLVAAQAAWREGRLHRVPSTARRIGHMLELGGIVLGFAVAFWLYRSRRHATIAKIATKE